MNKTDSVWLPKYDDQSEASKFITCVSTSSQYPITHRVQYYQKNWFSTTIWGFLNGNEKILDFKNFRFLNDFQSISNDQSDYVILTFIMLMKFVRHLTLTHILENDCPMVRMFGTPSVRLNLNVSVDLCTFCWQ